MSAHPTVTLATLLLAVPVTTAHALACVGAGRAVQWALGRLGPARPATQTSDAWVDLATQFLAGLMAFNAVFTVLGLMGQLRPVPVGVALALGWLALFLSRPRLAPAQAMLRDAWEWDIAAGSLIAERAGAKVTDRHGHAIRPDPRGR